MNRYEGGCSNPIFVRGISRSGGTLMTTILDAHPDLSMSYEIYEHLLITEKFDKSELEDFFLKGRQKSLSGLRSDLFSSKASSNLGLAKFILRARRSGITDKEFTQLISQHFMAGFQFDNFDQRMTFVESVAREKMKKEEKQRWGAKIPSTYEQLAKKYPDARYLFMLRDGRDVAASRKNTGDFKGSIEMVAKSWLGQIGRFEKFREEAINEAFFVSYENLIASPESELRRITNNLCLTWNESVLNFFEADLTLFNDSVGHLSGKQVKAPLNSSSIERWRRELTLSEVDEFHRVAGVALERWGYL